MFDQEVEFQLWEDDAPGGGHDAVINKNNRHTRTYRAKVNEKGIAEAKIPLSGDERILRQIANKYLMKGDKSEGKNHEYYITASYHGKIQKASQVNVDVTNPDYKKEQPKQQTPPKYQSPSTPKPQEPKKPVSQPQKAQPKQNTPKFPATKTSTAPRQADAQARITDAYFVNNSGQKLSKVTVGDKIRVRIASSNMKDKHIQYLIWEYDALGSNDEIYRSNKIKLGYDLADMPEINITKEMFNKGIDLWGDPDKDSQNYFIEVLPLDVSAYSKRFGVSSDGLMKVEKIKSAAVVSNPKQNKTNGTCSCKQYDLVWGDKVSCEFRKKVIQIAQNLGLPQQNYEGANWLMTIMALESAYSFSPKCGTFGKNPDESSKYKYIGLIQFGKAAAEEVGTTRTHLMSLTAEQQLDYVEKHFQLKQFKNLLNNRTALYLSVNYPSATKHASEKNYVVYDSI